jgi:Na+/H+ antiporter NhaD/arsenite permease-like protein
MLGSVALEGPVNPIPAWALVPFGLLLLAIATGPVAFAAWWHRHYAKVALGLGGVVAAYYLTARNEGGAGVHVLLEVGIDYFAFVSLIGSLFVISSAVLVEVHGPGTTRVNVAILGTASFLASAIGTTGASMLFIRPFWRINRKHFGAHHAAFFIFLVSNVGGALTPIGDPPLFLGFLVGIPFFWPAERIALPWFLTTTALLLAFAAVDQFHARKRPREASGDMIRVEVAGFGSLPFLFAILGLVLTQGQPWAVKLAPWSKLAAGAAMAALAVGAYVKANPKILKANEFAFGPVKEVMIVFAGIFATMIPALQYVQENQDALGLKTPVAYYFVTGLLSSLLDNAPTYLTFLTSHLAQHGRSIGEPAQVLAHLSDPAGAAGVGAISAAAVFFGAMTYIGNGPNLMVKAILESAGVKLPTFFGFMLRWSIPILLPILTIVGFLFYRSSP